MKLQGLSANWPQVQDAVRSYWPRLTDSDVASISGRRDELMRILKARYDKTYGEIERELIEFELRDVRAAYAARPSLGIAND